MNSLLMQAKPLPQIPNILVNSGDGELLILTFYEQLNFKYPKLSRGDQKLCALVKLNLSSKEMAKLLGISIESVHTNRYRLRKKLGLTREVSLTEFVAKL